MAFQIRGAVELQLAAGASSRLRREIRQALGSGSLPVTVSVQGQSGLTNLHGQLTQVRTAALAVQGGLGSLATRAGLTGAAFHAAGAGLSAFTGRLRESASAAVLFDRELVKLAQVAEEPRSAVRALGRDIDRLARTYGTSANELARAAVTIKAAGYSLRDTRTILDAINAASLTPNFGDLSQVAETVVALRQFGVEAGNVRGILGSVNAVAGAFAVSAEDISDAYRRAGGAAKAAGVDAVELAALYTSIRNSTQESSEVVSRGLASIFGRIQRPVVLDQLKALGVNLTDTEGLFIGGYRAVQQLGSALGALPAGDPRFAQLVEALGGLEQMSRVIPLLRETATAERALQVARAGRNSLDIAAAQQQDSLSASLGRAQQALEGVGRAATESRGLRSLVSLLSSGAEAAAGLAQHLGPVLPLVAGLTGARLLAAAGPVVGGAVGGITRQQALIGGGLAGAAFLPGVLGAPDRVTSTLSGAAAGAALGSVGGPFGAAIGGAVGGLIALRDSAKSAADAISQGTIDRNLTQAGNRLTDLRAGDNPAAAVALDKLLADTRAEVERRAADTSRPFLGRRDPAAFEAALARETRVNLGPRATEFAEAASSQATRLGARNPDADPGQLVARFRQENANLLRVLGSLNGQSPDDLLKGFADVIRAGQQGARGRAETVRLEDGTLRVLSAFGRLSDSVERAARGLTDLNQRTAALDALASGAGPVRPSALDSTDPRTLARLVSPLGAQGRLLVERAEADRRLREVLPSSLAEAASGPALDGATFGTRVRELVTAALGGKVGGQERAGLEVITNDIGRRDLDDVLRAARDPSRLTDDLLKGFAPTDTTARLAASASEFAATIAGALDSTAARVREIGEGADRVAELRLGAVRARATVRAETLGGGGVNLSLPALLAPFDAWQRRLLGGTGLAPENVGEIAARLGRTRGEILSATAARDAAVGTREGLTAAERLSRLTSEADSLQTALKNLADPMGRAAALQERLNNLNADRDSRLGFAERFVFAGPEERSRLTRGQGLAAALNRRPEQFDRLSVDDQRLSIEAARLIGSARFGNGQTGEGLRATLLARTGVLNAADERERAGLLGEQARVAGQAVDAQDALVRYQRETNDQFLSGLRTTQETFSARLGSLLLAGRLSEARTVAGGAAETLRTVREQAAERDAVRALGITFTGKDDVERLRTYRPQLAEFATGQADLTRYRQERRTLGASTDFAALLKEQGGAFGEDTVDALTRGLITRGVDARAAGETARDAESQFVRLVAERRLNRFAPETLELRTAFNDAARGSLATVTAAEVGRRSGPLSELGGRLTRGIPGLDLDKLTPASLATLDKALETFGRAGSGLGTLDKRAKDAATAFEQATAAVKELEGAVRGKPSLPGVGAVVGGAVFRAMGGPVPPGGPRGTDVVGAWLSPGEHVVNAVSAAANRGLLNRINAARGPLYLADGGFVGPPTRRQLLEEEIAAAQAANTAVRVRRDGRELAAAQAAATAERNRVPNALLSADPNGQFALDQLGKRASLSQLARANPGRQVGSLLLQQAYAGAADLPGESDQYGAAAGRLAGREARDAKRFRDSFGGRFTEYGNRLRESEAARRHTKAALSGSASFSFYGAGMSVRRFADGGLVPGWGTTDSVPAALQRGEFVLTREATRDIGIARLNEWNKRARFADGGLVGGGSGGSSGGAFGLSNQAAAAIQSFAAESASLSQALTGFGSPAQTLASALTGFGPAAERLASSIDKIPGEIKCDGQFRVDVNHNGAQALESMKGELASLIDRKIADALRAEFSARQPEQPSPLHSDPSRV